jgi:hypothetical protein
LVLGAIALAESAWLYAIFGVGGAVLGLNGSPMSWPAVLFLLTFSLVAGRLTPVNVQAVEAVVMARTLIAAILLYVIVGTQVAPGTYGINLTWIATAISGDAGSDYAVRALAGVAVGVVLYARGSKLAVTEHPTSSLGFSFRLGIPALAFATLVDLADPADLNTFPMIFIFFASGLGGLSIGHLLPGTQQSARARTWPKAITGIVSIVLLVGLGLGLLRNDLLTSASSTVAGWLFLAVKGLLWGIVVPIAFVLTIFVDAVIAFFSRPYDPELEPLPSPEPRNAPESTFEGGPVEFVEQEAPGAAFQWIEVIQWVLVAAVTLVVLYFVFKLLVRLARQGKRDTPGDRESVIEDASIGEDIMKLLGRLVPDWMKRRGQRAKASVPHGPSGIVEVLRIYYDLLAMAEAKGFRRRNYQTTIEFQATLQEVFAHDVVRIVTNAFNRAFYGHHPSTDDQIAHMRSSVRGLASGRA